ncbi:MAG: oligosaccharide flippase family protein, partial [Thermoplasmata archaeon YP2-bin.285]|nr:oligosaccharide flippase family protein [Candidatus Sysuiplasma superficiale]
MTEFTDTEPLGRGILYQYAYFATLTLAGAAFYIYVIHIFPKDLVGSVALLIAILSLFPVVFSFGLQYGWQHFTSYSLGVHNDESVKGIVQKAIKVGLLLSALSVIALVVLARPISFLFFHSYSYLELVYLLAFDIPSSIMITFFNSLMLGLQNFRKAGTIGMAYVIVVYGTSIIALHFTHSIYSIPLGWGVGYFAGAILYYVDIRRRLRAKRSSPFELKPLFSYSLPLYITGILSYGAVYVDRLTVAYLKDLSSIGVYNLALLISSGTSILSSPIGGIIFSKFSEFYARQDHEMIKEGVRIATDAASILYVPAALGVAAISVPVIKLLAGAGYLEGAIPLSIILVVNALFVFGGPLGNAMQGIRKTRVFVMSTGLALFSNTFLSFTLIPRLSLV